MIAIHDAFFFLRFTCEPFRCSVSGAVEVGGLEKWMGHWRDDSLTLRKSDFQEGDPVV